ncbi:MAG: amidohydrolase family protein [Myxococcales bacterium]|nr:amidohydrolase family protein [Myxococcales bacterium]
MARIAHGPGGRSMWRGCVLSIVLLACAPEEESPVVSAGMEPLTNVIDIHGHHGTLRTDYGQYDITTESFLSVLSASQVKWVVVSNLDGASVEGGADVQQSAANAATSKLVREHPSRVRGLLWAKPNEGTPSELIPFTSERLPDGSRVFVGVKLHPDWQSVSAADTSIDGYMAVCRAAGLTMMIHTDVSSPLSHPEKVFDLGKRFPDVPIVLYHMGFFGEHEVAMEVVRRATAEGSANLYLETSSASAEDILAAIRQVGAERVLFGSDVPYFGALHYAIYGSILETLRSALPPAEYALVTHGNAQRLLGLE